MEQVTPVNITAAAMIMQFSISIIVAMAAAMLRWYEQYDSFNYFKPGRLASIWVIIGFSLSTMGLLLFSDQLSSVWRPLFGGAGFNGLPWSLALATVFVADAVWIAIMVARSGGSMDSAFSPVWYILPPMALFLREPGGRLILYLVVITILFSYNLYAPLNPSRQGRHKIAYWTVSIACLVLTTFIGYITRPR